MHNRTRRTAASLVIATLIAAGALLATAAPAEAAPTIFPLHGPHKTIEYGAPWQIYSYIRSYRDDLTVIANVDGSDYYLKDSFYEGHFQLDNNEGGGKLDKALDVGTHLITMRIQNGGTLVAQSDAPFHLVIGPTAISTTTLITPDPNNSRNAVVTAELNGYFIDGLPNCACESDSGDFLPGGTWKVTVTTANGKVAFRREATVAAGKFAPPPSYQVIGGNPFYVAYWPDLPAGESLTATSSFTPSTDHAKDFTMSSTPFSYTSAGTVAGATPTSRPTASATTTAASNGLPFWVLLAALVLVILLLLLDVILLILRSRRRGNAGPSTAAPITEGGAE
jgi:hypothetical protein